jgi:hypothetical protein
MLPIRSVGAPSSSRGKGVYKCRLASIDATTVGVTKAERMGTRLASPGQASIGRWKPANDGAADDQADIKTIGVQERILLFCLASRTDWKRAGVTPKTVAGMVMKYLVTPTWASGAPPPLPLTDYGRATPTGAVAGPELRGSLESARAHRPQ